MPDYLSSAGTAAAVYEWVALEIALLQIATVLFLVLLNGFFVASEFAIVKVRDSQLEELARQGVKRAAGARHVLAHLDAYLSATQLGITLASLGLGWVGEPFLAHMLRPFFVLAGVNSDAVITTVSFALAFAVITFLHIVLGELAPKSLAIRKPVPTTLWVSRPLEIFHAVFRPAIWVLNGAANILLKYIFRLEPVSDHESVHSEEELRLLVAESGKAQALSAKGAGISARAFGLRHLSVRDIAIPRPSVVFLELEDSMEENVRRAKRSEHTRFPLCRGHLDDAVGLIHIKDLIVGEEEPTPDLASIRRELLRVPEMMSLERLLDLFLTSHSHMALVLDEFGGAAGIVTLEDVMEELVGEIQDEFDAEQPPLQRTSATEFTVGGYLSLHEFDQLTGLKLESDEVTTVGGYLTQLMGRLPQQGESTRIAHYRATVIQGDGRRVQRIRFEQITEPKAD